MKYSERRMYNLFVDKNNHEMKIIRVRNKDNHLMTTYTEDVQCYNQFYFVCTDKNKLKEKATEIKKVWICELEKNLKKVKDIKI